VKVVLDTSVYVDACRSADARARFRSAFLPLLPVTYLAAVVAYELRINALDPETRGLIDAMIHLLQRTGRGGWSFSRCRSRRAAALARPWHAC